MSLEKNGLVIDCEHCVCRSEDGHGAFSIDVPVSDRESGVTGLARIRCEVSSERHSVELGDLALDKQDAPPGAVRTMRERAAPVLAYVAQKRVCGNRHICPPDVIRIVERHSRS